MRIQSPLSCESAKSASSVMEAKTSGRTAALLVTVINFDSEFCIISYLDPWIEHGWWALHTTWQPAQKAYAAGHTCTNNTQIHWESIATKRQRQSIFIEFRKIPVSNGVFFVFNFLTYRYAYQAFFLLFWSFLCFHSLLNWNHFQEWCWKVLWMLVCFW